MLGVDPVVELEEAAMEDALLVVVGISEVVEEGEGVDEAVALEGRSWGGELL